LVLGDVDQLLFHQQDGPGTLAQQDALQRLLRRVVLLGQPQLPAVAPLQLPVAGPVLLLLRRVARRLRLGDAVVEHGGLVVPADARSRSSTARAWAMSPFCTWARSASPSRARVICASRISPVPSLSWAWTAFSTGASPASTLS